MNASRDGVAGGAGHDIGTATTDVALNPTLTIGAVAALFSAHGATTRNAQVLAEHLVESERLGLPSHGLLRVRQYLSEIRNGQLKPDARPSAEDREATIVHIDGHSGFGQVAGEEAARIAVRKASHQGTAFVTVRNVQHTGRLGAYTELVAGEGYFALAFASGAPRFHRVVPFGGRDGRLSTNPIAWAAPMSDGILSADFSTSAVPEGRLRLLHATGQQAPPDTICDADGTPTGDTRLFYGDTEAGIDAGGLLPLGGPLFGYKGYALGLLSECIATVMAGEVSASTTRANNLALIAIKGDGELPSRTTATVEYIKSARPAREGADVLVPGEPEKRHLAAHGQVVVPGFLWVALREDFEDAGVPAGTLRADNGRNGQSEA